jgi:hypothetical protein
VDILRNLFGSLTSGIIRLMVAVGILAAAYILIVKPVLHTTDEAIKSSGIDQITKTIRSVNHDVQQEIRHSFSATRKNGANPQRLIHCIQRADNNVAKLRRCTVRF